MSTEDFLLSSENLSTYLAACGLVRRAEDIVVRELGGGVSNIVLLVESPADAAPRWVVKQSLGKLRVQDDWRSDRERIFREAEAIQGLRPVLGDAVPEVVHVDRHNHLYVMAAAPTGSVAWKEQLLGRRADLAVAREAGTLLARIINASRADPQFQEKFADRTVFDQLRIDPYYRTTAARHPDVASALGELMADSWRIQTALVHGDYSPKNMLVCGSKIFLIDFEVIHWGDPAFDAAFLLNHLLLKAFHQPRFAEMCGGLICEFWQTLVTALALAPRAEYRLPRAGDFERMTLRHLGGLMLARIDGKSPVEYIRDEVTKQSVRRVAKRILLGRLSNLEEALDLALREMPDVV